MPLSGLNPTGGHSAFGDGDTEIFLRGRGLGLGFGFMEVEGEAVDGDFVVDAVGAVALLVVFEVGLADGLEVALAELLGTALTLTLGVGVGDGFLVAATAVAPGTARAMTSASEIFPNRAPI